MWEKFFTDFSFMENPELSDLRQMAKKDEIPNRYGIPVYHSKNQVEECQVYRVPL